VKDWGENGERYGDNLYRRVGYAKVGAIVSDASNSIFTPCSYRVEDVKLLEGQHGELVSIVSSFRGRFCEQAEEGENVIAQGKVERVQSKSGQVEFRLLLGGKSSDFMILGEPAVEA
jgi:predicted nucleotidyltransferase